jgi:protein-S-isoprenylcysteine O-methyltransferase Ste14
MPRLFTLAGGYLALQATGVAGWWVALLVRPEWRWHFQFDSEIALMAFWLPDLLLLAGASAIVSRLCFRRHQFAVPGIWFVAGGVSYATLYCLAGSLRTNAGWLGVVLMAAAMLVTLSLAIALLPNSSMLFREARPAHARYNLLKTFIQIIVFWTTLLFVFPALLAMLQERIGIPFLEFPGQLAIAALLFIGFSAFGLWSGLTMALNGEGTPLPVDSTRRLVSTGPYAVVRNPMAVAGLGQGLAVTLFTGSVLVLGYTILGALLWHCVARPLEEEDLARKFAGDYEDYRTRVGLWIPLQRVSPRAPVK